MVGEIGELGAAGDEEMERFVGEVLAPGEVQVLEALHRPERA